MPTSSELDAVVFTKRPLTVQEYSLTHGMLQLTTEEHGEWLLLAAELLSMRSATSIEWWLTAGIEDMGNAVARMSRAAPSGEDDEEDNEALLKAIQKMLDRGES